jgi:hypothetical protein
MLFQIWDSGQLKGVVVNGNDVTATGLFVEHFQEHNVIWNGERGRVCFFQNELSYSKIHRPKQIGRLLMARSVGRHTRSMTPSLHTSCGPEVYTATIEMTPPWSLKTAGRSPKLLE